MRASIIGCGWRPHALLLGTGICLLLAAPALVAQQPTGVLDQMALDYREASTGWISRIQAVTTNLFFWLALFEFLIAAIMYMIAAPQAREEKAGKFLVKIMLVSFVYMLITQWDYWIVRLVDSFTAVGEHAAGQIFSPSLVVDFGLALSGSVMRTLNISDSVTNPPIVLFTVLTAFAILICYILIATQMVITQVESYLVVSSGIFFLAFGAFRATASIAENYLLYCVHVGIKLMMLYLILSVGGSLTATWAEILANDRFLALDQGPLLRVFSGVAVLTFLVWYIPNKIAGRITGGASLGLAAAMRGSS